MPPSLLSATSLIVSYHLNIESSWSVQSSGCEVADNESLLAVLLESVYLDSESALKETEASEDGHMKTKKNMSAFFLSVNCRLPLF